MKPRQWRDAIRDSSLDATAKVVAYTLSTYMNGAGEAFPSKETLAAGAGKSKRAVDGAIERIAAAGFLDVSKSKGRSSNRYVATPPTVQATAGLTVQTVAPLEKPNPADSSTSTLQNSTPNGAELDTSTVQVAAPESGLKAKTESRVEGEGTARRRNWTCDFVLKDGEVCGSTFGSESKLEEHKRDHGLGLSELVSEQLREMIP